MGTEAMTTDEKSEIEEKVADALEENYEKHDVVARAHTGDNTEEESDAEDVMAETHYQLGVAQAHSGDYASAEKSLEAAVVVLDARISNLKKMETSDNITKELTELTLLCTEIKERAADHKEMQKGTYKPDNDFVSIFKGAEVHEIATKKAGATA